MCSKNFNIIIITDNLVKIDFSLPCSRNFHPVGILRLILANAKKLYKNYLRLKTPVLITILRHSYKTNSV